MMEPTTDFGRFLLKLIHDRNIGGGASGLAIVMENADGDYSISSGAISHYIAGRSRASVKFALHLCEALSLTEDEKHELAWVFLFGQKSGTTG